MRSNSAIPKNDQRNKLLDDSDNSKLINLSNSKLVTDNLSTNTLLNDSNNTDSNINVNDNNKNEIDSMNFDNVSLSPRSRGNKGRISAHRSSLSFHQNMNYSNGRYSPILAEKALNLLSSGDSNVLNRSPTLKRSQFFHSRRSSILKLNRKSIDSPKSPDHVPIILMPAELDSKISEINSEEFKYYFVPKEEPELMEKAIKFFLDYPSSKNVECILLILAFLVHYKSDSNSISISELIKSLFSKIDISNSSITPILKFVQHHFHLANITHKKLKYQEKDEKISFKYISNIEKTIDPQFSPAPFQSLKFIIEFQSKIMKLHFNFLIFFQIIMNILFLFQLMELQILMIDLLQIKVEIVHYGDIYGK